MAEFESLQTWRTTRAGAATGIAIALFWAVGIPVIGIMHKPSPHLAPLVVGGAFGLCMGFITAYITFRPMLAISDRQVKVRNFGRTEIVELERIASTSPSQFGLRIRLDDGRRLDAMIAGGHLTTRPSEIRQAVESAIAMRKNELRGGSPTGTTAR